MKKLKPVKVSEAMILYKVKNYGAVCRGLLPAVDWPENLPWLGIEFKSQPLPERMPRSSLPRNYNQLLCCFSPRRGVKAPAQTCPDAGISVRPPKNLAELKRVQDLCFRHYMRAWKSKTGPAFIADYRNYLKNYLHKTKSMVLLKDGRPCGLFSHLPLMRSNKKVCDHVTWHYLIPGLSVSEKRDALCKAAQWLERTVKRQLSVCLELYDKQSYEFYSALGLVFPRVLIERRKK